MYMPLNEANSLRLSQLKKEIIRLRKEIPKLNGTMKEEAIKTFSELFKEIIRLEHIEESIYLLRYE